ncbi:MAG: hypothetical protein AAGG48_28680 [Planctomycetota bacterium]
MKFSIAQLLLLTAAFALVVAVAQNFIVAVFGVALSICFALVAYPFAVLSSPQKDTYLDIHANKFIRFLNSLLLFGTIVIFISVVFSFLMYLW